MQPWMTPTEEVRAVKRAAARAGCPLSHVRWLETRSGRRAQVNLSCRDGWAAATMLTSLSVDDGKTAGARDLALELRTNAPDDQSFARSVQDFVRSRVRFVREPGEVFTGASYTLDVGAGDCDDQARVVYALLRAGGLPARLAFMYSPGATGPSHVAAQAGIAGAWPWLETTIAARFGEHPFDAGKRLGLLGARRDLASEVRTMSEGDLPPVPADYVAKNPPADVSVDARCLNALGYSCDETNTDPTDGAFRDALLKFQVDHNLTTDGLTGPQTREALGHACRVAGLSELADTMGAIEATKLTSHLSDGFFQLVAKMAQDFRAKGAKVTGADFLAAFMSESGVRADSMNPKFPDFGGLNQMNSVSRKAVGFTGTADEWRALSAEAQMPYVRRYFEVDVQSFCGGDYSCLANAGAMYLMNFMPAYMKHAGEPSFILTHKSPADDGSQAYLSAHLGDTYAANRYLDVGNKGWIAVSDMQAALNRVVAQQPAYWKELTARLAAAGETGGLTGDGGGLATRIALGIVGVGILAFGAHQLLGWPTWPTSFPWSGPGGLFG